MPLPGVPAIIFDEDLDIGTPEFAHNPLDVVNLHRQLRLHGK
jgi:hypothetical protein